jgi:hypothetical protein
MCIHMIYVGIIIIIICYDGFRLRTFETGAVNGPVSIPQSPRYMSEYGTAVE